MGKTVNVIGCYQAKLSNGSMLQLVAYFREYDRKQVLDLKSVTLDEYQVSTSLFFGVS